MDQGHRVPTPKTPSHTTTRDDRLRIQTLYYTAGWSIDDLLLQGPFTRRQIDYALQSRLTPQKKGHSGRHILLDTPRRKELVAWVTASSYNRDVPWAQIPRHIGWEWCGESAIRTALKREGYIRGVRRKKPPLSEKNIRERLAWAYEHESWTLDQWDSILWSDESWVQPGYHRRQFCTRLQGPSELYIPDCITHKWQRKIGWMFWGSISGKYGKGPGFFWEKEWKSITSATYCQHTLPKVVNYLWNHPGLSFQQDGGPGHNAQATLRYLKSWSIIPIFWPAFSPDLSPIEWIWKRMKDLLQEINPEVHRDYQRLRADVQRAWDSITDAEIREMIHTMPQRCKDVIKARGGPTEW